MDFLICILYGSGQTARYIQFIVLIILGQGKMNRHLAGQITLSRAAHSIRHNVEQPLSCQMALIWRNIDIPAHTILIRLVCTFATDMVAHANRDLYLLDAVRGHR